MTDMTDIRVRARCEAGLHRRHPLTTAHEITHGAVRPEFFLAAVTRALLRMAEHLDLRVDLGRPLARLKYPAWQSCRRAA